MDILFKNISVLCEGEVRHNQYVAVTGRDIAYIGDHAPEGTPRRAIDGAGRLLTPGFTNLHSHVPMTLLRGYAEGLPLHRWLNEMIFPVEARMTDEDIEYGSLLGAAEMIRCGVTSFSDMYDKCDVIARVVGESGLKANISRALMFFGDGFDPASDQRVREAEELFAQFNGAFDGRVVIDWSVHAEYTSGPELVRFAADRAKQLGARMHVHVSETLSEHEECIGRRGMTPTAYLASLELFDVPAVAAHCTHITPEDMDILSERGVTVAHCPSSNLKLGSGIAPVQQMLDRGVRVAFGTDGASSNNNLNIPEEMHIAALLQKGALRDPMAMQAGVVFSMATRAGAVAQGREDTGLIAEGMRADLVMWDMTAPHMRPCHDALSNLVYSAQAQDVLMTMADGRVLYENGEHKTLDMERVYAGLDRRVAALFG